MKHRFCYTLCAAAVALAAVMCGACNHGGGSAEKPEEQGPPPVLGAGYEGTVGGIAYSLPDLGSEVCLHTELQQGFLNQKYYNNNVFDYAKGDEELSAPAPVAFRWTAEGADPGAVYTLRVSETEDFADPLVYTAETCSLDVYNLKIATTYWWTVAADGKESGAAIFTTEDQGPRNLLVEGVANVRDVGGWKIEGGGRVKQGLLFRTGHLNKDYFGDALITEAGMRTMTEELKVRTEIDLRGGSNDPDEYAPGVNKSVLEGVTYYHIGMNWTDLLGLNKAELRIVFGILAQESSYPLFYHCSIGTDRTGIISYLLLGLLGVEERSIYCDYLFSNFANIGGQRDLGNITTKYGATINNQYGGRSTPLRDKCRAALLDIGVEPAELDNIVRLLTE